MINKVLR